MHEKPQYPYAYVRPGKIDADLGRKDDALRESRRGWFNRSNYFLYWHIVEETEAFARDIVAKYTPCQTVALAQTLTR